MANTIRVVERGEQSFIAHITDQRDKTECYHCTELPDRGDRIRRFDIRKLDGTVYRVVLATRHQQCDCPGHIYHGHCKHCKGISALIERGVV